MSPHSLEIITELKNIVDDLFYRSDDIQSHIDSIENRLSELEKPTGGESIDSEIKPILSLIRAKILELQHKPDFEHLASRALDGLNHNEGRLRRYCQLLLLDPKAIESSGDAALGKIHRIIEESLCENDPATEALALALLAKKLDCSAGKMQEAIDYNRQAIAKFTALGSMRLQAQCWNGLGIIFGLSGEHSQAVKAFESAITIAENCATTTIVPGAMMNMALSLSRLGNHEQEITCLVRALESFRVSKNSFGIFLCLLNIGVFHLEKSDIDSALKHLIEAGSLDDLDPPPSARVLLLLSLGRCYAAKGNCDEAKRYLDGADAIDAELNDHQSRFDLLIAWAIYHESIGETEAALNWYARATDYACTSQVDEHQISALLNLGKFLNLHQETLDTLNTLESFQKIQKSISLTDSCQNWAEALLLRAVELARDSNLKDKLSETHQVLAQFYKKCGDYERAFHHLESFARVSEEMLKHQLELKIELLKLQTDLGKTQHENTVIQEKNSLLKAEIEKRKVIEAELEQKNIALHERNSEKDAILGIVAHDLRNPISAVISITELLEQSEPGEELREWLPSISSSLESMLEITNGLLDLRESKQSIPSNQADDVHINGLVVDLIARYQGSAENKDIRLVNIGATLPPIHWQTDKKLLARCVENLLSNAIKYALQNTEVTVGFDVDQEGLFIAVTDQGPGLNEEDQKHLFKEFAKLSPTPTAGEPSIGIGLSIVKRTIESLGGSVSCRSVIGVGSTFELKLPRQQ